MLEIKDGILKQFVENLELNNGNILRIIRMRSYSGAEALPFSSDHVAWRETASDPYCNYDSSEELSLRWTNVSTANAVQFWRIAPAGFGIFFDVRSGSQLVIIATPECTDDEGDKHFFTRWGHFLQDFDGLDPELFSENTLEAIRLEPGNRLLVVTLICDKLSLKLFLHSVLRPNTPFVVISLENTVITGGFYLSSCTMYETLMGRIHSFILPSLLTEGRNPPFSIFVQRMVHYMHNAYVVNDSSDRGHLLAFSSMDDARDLLSLVTLAIFLNVLDERTYKLSLETYQDDPIALQRSYDIFDLNAIPVIERYHLSYTRGLSLDLLEWVFENYVFSSVELEEEDVDAFGTIFVLFIVYIGRQIAKYKRTAEEHGRTTSSTYKQVNFQIQSALFSLESTRDVWLEEKAAEEEKNHNRDDEGDEADVWDLDSNLSGYTIARRDIPAERKPCENFLEEGKTSADKRFFRGLTFQFKLDDQGEKFISKELYIP